MISFTAIFHCYHRTGPFPRIREFGSRCRCSCRLPGCRCTRLLKACLNLLFSCFALLSDNRGTGQSSCQKPHPFQRLRNNEKYTLEKKNLNHPSYDNLNFACWLVESSVQIVDSKKCSWEREVENVAWEYLIFVQHRRVEFRLTLTVTRRNDQR